MKGLIVIIAAFILVFGTVASHAANVGRISVATGVPVATLQAQRASTGLGWGSLEKAHLLANATGQSFDDVVAQHRSGQGWGRIARNNGLKLGTLVSNAHRSNQAATHARNLNTTRGKSSALHGKSTAVRGKSTTLRGRKASNIGRGHTRKVTSARGVGHRSSLRSGSGGSHRMRSMGHMSGSRGMRSMGHGGGHGR